MSFEPLLTSCTEAALLSMRPNKQTHRADLTRHSSPSRVSSICRRTRQAGNARSHVREGAANAVPLSLFVPSFPRHVPALLKESPHRQADD